MSYNCACDESYLVDQLRLEEQVGEADQGEGTQKAHQYTAQHQEATATRQQCRTTECNENDAGGHECGDNDLWVEGDDTVQQWSNGVAGQETEAK